MKFYSHPNKLLKEHLKEVSERSINYFKYNFEEDLIVISKLIGLTHDFGKYTTFFQKKLIDEDTDKSLSDHSLISSIFTFYTVKKIINNLNINERLKSFLPLISFFVVLHHHRDLTSLDYINDILELDDNTVKVKNQIENIINNKNEIEYDLKELNLDFVNLDEFKSSIDNLIEEIKSKIFEYRIINEEKVKIEIFFIILALFSALIDSDKKSASNLQDIESVYIPSDIVDKYKEIKFKNIEKNIINNLREEIYKNVVEQVDKIDLKQRIYTLTSPTGSGKTLTSISFAFKLRDRIKRELNYTPKIIYSLPFISIIDQNFTEIEKILSLIDDFNKNKSKYLLAHHYLSSTKYETENEDYDIEKSTLFIESWDSEIIITTFVQFLETIIGYKNRFLKKYHNISNSIILLDEVQNIPIEYWDLIEFIFYYLTKYLNTYIILLTATKPLIFRNLIKPQELLINHEKYFSKFERIKIVPKFNIKKDDQLISFIEILIKEHKSLMIVLNTINSSIEIYNKVKERNLVDNIVYLSANIIPKQRLERIKAIRKFIEEKKKFIVVSTQVIEAGVDIDLECVIRDIGPFDSIVQVGGRCNREFNLYLGEVYVVHLHNEKERLYSEFVYKKLAPSLTYEILSKIKELNERDFLNYINLYFEEIIKRKSFELSEKIINSILDLTFYDNRKEYSVSKFKLIDDFLTIPIFIELDDYANEIFNRFKEIIDNKTLKPWEKRFKILEFNNEFQSYIVNVRVLEEKPPLTLLFERNLGYVSKNELDKFYSLETGFKKQGGIEYII